MALPNLDDLIEIREIDPGSMMDTVLRFPEQCEEAVELAGSYDPAEEFADARQIVVSGLGSSGIVGDMLRALLTKQLTIPVTTNRDYHLPLCVNDRTLTVMVSESGNTEETLSAYDEAKKIGARLLSVTSGGTLAERAEADGTDLIRIPGGVPARAAVGYMFIPLLIATEKLRITSGWIPQIQPALKLLRKQRQDYGPKTERDENRAKELARDLYTRIPLLYGGPGVSEIVATRWKGQINLNSKMHAFVNAFPELNHNEIDGWETANLQSESFAVVIVRDQSDKSRTLDRIEITKTLIPKGYPVHDVTLDGDTELEKLLSGFYLADFVSVYLAILNRVDPSETTGVEAIKEELGRVVVSNDER